MRTDSSSIPEARLHVGEGHAHHLELGLRPARADAEHRTAARHVVERGDGLGGRGRMAEQVAEDQRAEPRARRHRADRAEDGRRFPRVGAVVEAAPALSLVRPVVRDVERRVAQALRLLRRLEQVRRGQRRELHSEIHPGSLRGAAGRVNI
jgi:hypothetical protein